MTTLRESRRSGIRSESCCGKRVGRLLVAYLTRRPRTAAVPISHSTAAMDFLATVVVVVAELGMPLEYSGDKGEFAVDRQIVSGTSLCLNQRKGFASSRPNGAVGPALPDQCHGYVDHPSRSRQWDGRRRPWLIAITVVSSDRIVNSTR